MTHRVGTCSICGGDVMGNRYLWSIDPPALDECASCYAVRPLDILTMSPRPPRPIPTNDRTAP